MEAARAAGAAPAASAPAPAPAPERTSPALPELPAREAYDSWACPGGIRETRAGRACPSYCSKGRCPHTRQHQRQLEVPAHRGPSRTGRGPGRAAAARTNTNDPSRHASPAQVTRLGFPYPDADAAHATFAAAQETIAASCSRTDTLARLSVTQVLDLSHSMKMYIGIITCKYLQQS